MEATSTSGYPVALRLNDGNTLFVELLPSMIRKDRDGSIGYTPDGMKFLDRLRALAQKVEDQPTPGYLAALRSALGLTQKQLGEELGVDKLTVSRWERGEVRPGAASIRKLRSLRNAAARRGVIVHA